MLNRLRRRWLTLLGAWVLALGLVAAVWTNQTETRLLGEASLGVAILAPPKDTPEWHERMQLRARADCGFWLGMSLAALGLVLQTAGAILDR
jgi:hypothetical protein